MKAMQIIFCLKNYDFIILRIIKSHWNRLGRWGNQCVEISKIKYNDQIINPEFFETYIKIILWICYVYFDLKSSISD